MVDSRAISRLAEALIKRAGVESERDLFRVLARAYFRDRERALGGADVPFTTLMLEAARMISDHLIEVALRPGGPGFRGLDLGGAGLDGAGLGGAGRLLSGDVRVHSIIVEVLTGAGRWAPGRALRLADAIAGPALWGGAFQGGALWLDGAA
ncbi:hypothetical protein [Winogradskya humida]|uniref:hypothetical protein n=1 Tax=Winogradskya humida TaxID=113566 RepID=UPI0019405773|nr:hypothetical protein [Actinoplanes humidus]